MRVTCFLIAMAAVVSVSAQGGGAADPWTAVPAMPVSPTGCFSDDGFGDRINSAIDANASALRRQEEANNAAKNRLNAVDMRDVMQRMQAFMAKNPQRAQEAIQAMQNMATGAKPAVLASAGDNQELMRQFKMHGASFDAAVKSVHAPVQRLIEDLKRTKGNTAFEGSGIGMTAPDAARYKALTAQLNTEYEQICGAWWGPTGTFTNWLKSYKTYVLNDIAAPQQKLDASLLMQFDMLGVPSTGFASIAALVGIREYQWKARDLYGLRPRRVPEPSVVIIN
jgi:hypothetical protein